MKFLSFLYSIKQKLYINSKNFIAAIFLLLLLVSAAYGDETFPFNVSRSLDNEIMQNPGISDAQIKKLASIILKKRFNLGPDRIQRMLAGLNIQQIKKIAAKEFQVSFFELPLEKAQSVLNFKFQATDPKFSELINSIYFFEKNGTTYVRWFQNPFSDSDYLVDMFRKSGFSEEESTLKTGTLKARFSASRTIYICCGPEKRVYLIKPSVDKFQVGSFVDKYVDHKEAVKWTTFSQMIDEVFGSAADDLFIREAGMFSLGNKAYSEGQTIRDSLPFERELLLPAFSVLTDDVGAEIARNNGSDNPVEFWRSHLIEPLAEISAKLYLDAGLIHNSLHSQNIVIRFDSNMKVLGLRIRDADFEVVVDRWKDTKWWKILAPTLDSKDRLESGKYPGRIGFMLVNGLSPSKVAKWLDKESYVEWVEYFHTIVAKRFSERHNLKLKPNALRSAIEFTLINPEDRSVETANLNDSLQHEVETVYQLRYSTLDLNNLVSPNNKAGADKVKYDEDKSTPKEVLLELGRKILVNLDEKNAEKLRFWDRDNLEKFLDEQFANPQSRKSSYFNSLLEANDFARINQILEIHMLKGLVPNSFFLEIAKRDLMDRISENAKYNIIVFRLIDYRSKNYDFIIRKIVETTSIETLRKVMHYLIESSRREVIIALSTRLKGTDLDFLEERIKERKSYEKANFSDVEALRYVKKRREVLARLALARPPFTCNILF
ncbi:MAG: hypothetical protein A4S09_10915 [Proteobacteria bacterium SG_bin7]|nr:MAG: hypothetical protein A4S09_10915 [Proteobacteria bacterium SG_bin7]